MLDMPNLICRMRGHIAQDQSGRFYYLVADALVSRTESTAKPRKAPLASSSWASAYAEIKESVMENGTLTLKVGHPTLPDDITLRFSGNAVQAVKASIAGRRKRYKSLEGRELVIYQDFNRNNGHFKPIAVSAFDIPPPNYLRKAILY